MIQPRKIALALVIVLAGAMALGMWGSPSEPAEPQHQGAGISRWFARFCLRNRAQMRVYNSVGALRAMDTNSLAYLFMLLDSPTNELAFARIEAQAQREVGNGDSPSDRLERMLIRVIDRDADAARAVLVEKWRIEESVHSALQFLRPDAGAWLPLLEAALKSPDARRRERALSLLAYVGPGVEQAEPWLIRGLNDEDDACRATAAEAAGSSGLTSPQLVTPMIAALEKSTSTNRGTIVWALGKMGTRARAAAPALARLMEQESNWRQKILTAEAVYEIVPGQPEAFKVLIEGLTDANYRKLAQRVLGPLWKSRAEAKQALPILLAVLDGDTYFARRVYAAEAVCELEPTNTRALKVLTEALSDGTHRRDAINVLSGLTPRPEMKLEHLSAVLPEEEFSEDARTFQLFLSVGARRSEAVGLLNKALASDVFRERVNAAAGLLSLEPNHAGALAVITPYLTQRDYPGWIVRAADALGLAGTNASAAMEALAKTLRETTPPVSDVVRASLAKVCPPTNEAPAK